MSSSVLEQTRMVHQDLEKHMQMMVEDLLQDNKTLKERILQETRVKMRLEEMQQSGKSLAELYSDAPGSARSQELAEMAGDQVFETFYNKMRDLRDHYRQFPDASPQQPNYEIKPKTKFSGAEVAGSFVDLHPFFERCINMQGMFPRMDYLTYLAKFDSCFSDIKQHVKTLPINFPIYKQYVAELVEYLFSFLERTNPLADVGVLAEMINEDFKAQWAEKKVVGWTGAAEEAKAALAQQHADDPLFCRPCNKLFNKESTYSAHLPGRKHKKAVASQGKEKAVDPREEELALLEFTVGAQAALLRETIENTRDYVVKKQTRTYDEMAADLEDQQQEEALSSSDSEEEEQTVYNPLNLPMGWDGKPIPYWLYKLHGLNIEYKCDICGGFSYRGPRAYERHFSEWRHTYGLRCLGIENSKAFLHITKFEDAIGLHEKLQASGSTNGLDAGENEEYEDDDGNVFNKKTYEDLKRQGII